MQWKSTPDRYGAMAIAIHWTAALLILALIASGLRAANAVDSVTKISLLRAHAVMGVGVAALTLARIAWWWFADRKPAPVAGIPPLQERAARIVQTLFYFVLLGMAASGMGMLALSGAGFVLFAGAEGPLADFWNYPPRVPHRIGFVLLLALLVLHLGGALHHQFIRRDHILARMGWGKARA